MDDDHFYENPWIGQQPDDTEHVMNYLNSDYGIMFPIDEFTESPEGYSAGIRNPALPPVEVDGLALPPAIDKHDVDAGDVPLNDVYPQAHTSLAEACWAFIVHPLLLALRPLWDLPYTLIILIYYLILIRMNGPFVRQIIPIILVEVTERYEPGASFFVNVVIGFLPHISEHFHLTLALLPQLCDQCQVFLIVLAVIALSAVEL